MIHPAHKRKIRHGVIAASCSVALVAAWVVVAPHVLPSDLHIGTQTVHLEFATSKAEQSQGLGGRASLPKDHGMLFIFPERGIYPFWMKGMQFPLDIIWIDRGTVTEVATLRPPTSTNAEPQEYEPRLPADHVLELNAGMANKLGIGPGTGLELPR